jgi:hypothetical protein
MAKTHSPGARQFRIVMLLAVAVAFAVLGVECIRHYLDYMHVVNNRGGQDIMRGVQQKATLTYWLFWSALAAAALLLAAPRSTVWVAYFLCLAILVEGAAQEFFLAGHGHLYQPLPAINYAMFDPPLPIPAVLSTASVTVRTIAAPPSTRKRSPTPS